LAFRPCGPHEEFAYGWTSPLGKTAQQLVHSANGFMMLCVKKKKVLPAAVVMKCSGKNSEKKSSRHANYPKKSALNQR